MLLECCKCDEKFDKSSNFIQHFNLKHIGVKEKKCPFKNCSSTFALKYNFRKHFKKFHLKYVISESKCDQIQILEEFTSKWIDSKISNSKKIGSNTCGTCAKTFSRKSNLTKHKKLFHGNFIAVKTLCPVEGCKTTGFKTKNNFVIHYKDYHLPKIHDQCDPANLCEICRNELIDAKQRFENKDTAQPAKAEHNRNARKRKTMLANDIKVKLNEMVASYGTESLSLCEIGAYHESVASIKNISKPVGL